ncbi:MAG: peptide ABC transporter substrate-binding protein [Clostridia bacterium]|nr:peptide ABC transporter substrate-binding protein [Clostridia bacterium]
MKLKKILALVLAATMSVCACVTASAEENMNAELYPGTAESGTLVFDIGMEPTSVNSLLGTYVADGRVTSAMLVGLTKKDENSNPVPAAAESWDVSDDGLVYTFHLRENMVWSNGTPLTANDYAFAWKMLMTADTGAEYAYFAYDTACIKNGREFYEGKCEWEDVGVKVIDDLTFEVTLHTPLPYFLSLLSQGCMLPVNEAYYNEVGADNYFMDPEYTIACGPYTMESWTHDSEIVLKKNPTFWDADSVNIETLIYKMYTNSDTRLNAFKAGEVDVIEITGDQVKALKAEGFTPVEYTTQSEYHILFNCEDKYMSNANLRKAIDACYSRNDFIAAIRKDSSVPANTFVPSPTAGFDGTSYSAACIEKIGTDGVVRNPDVQAELANEYLDKALEELGCTKEDLSAHLDMHCGDSDVAMTQAAFFQECIRQVLGIEISVTPMQTKAQSAERTAGNYVMDISGWVGDYNDPMTWYDMWVTGGGNNSVRFSNEEYDACIADALRNTDLEARQNDFYRCEEILLEEMPISCIYYRAGSYAVSGKVIDNYVIDAWQTNFFYANVK